MTTVSANTKCVLLTLTTHWKSLNQIAIAAGMPPHETFVELKKLEKLETASSKWEGVQMFWRLR